MLCCAVRVFVNLLTRSGEKELHTVTRPKFTTQIHAYVHKNTYTEKKNETYLRGSVLLTESFWKTTLMRIEIWGILKQNHTHITNFLGFILKSIHWKILRSQNYINRWYLFVESMAFKTNVPPEVNPQIAAPKWIIFKNT